MESSSQNSQKKTFANDETHLEENNSVEKKDSFKSDKITNEVESSFKNETFESKTVPSSSIGGSNIVPSETKKNCVAANNLIEETKINENNEESSSKPLNSSIIVETNVKNAEKDKNGVLTGIKLIDERKTYKGSAVTDGKVIPSTSSVEKKEASTRNSFLKTLKTAEYNAESSSEPLDSRNMVDPNVITSEKNINKMTKISMQKMQEISQKLAVIMSYAARQQRPKQPFIPPHRNARAPPPPPHYYISSQPPQPRQRGVEDTRRDPRPEPMQEPSQEPRQETRQEARQDIRFDNRQATPQSSSQGRHQPQYVHHYNIPHYVPLSQLSTFPYIMSHEAEWAAYPAKLPGNVSASLAHLIDAEVLFVLQRFDVIELLTGIPEPNFYLILNKHGECLYYAYETSDLCASSFLGNTRGFQLHILDVYQNEVIFMNRPCGCTYLFCCYPVIEVYSPPTVPLGAVTKMCVGCKEIFAVIDVDENILFTIHGDKNCGVFCGYTDADITIHALDANRTQVGFIRREFILNPLAYLQDFDYYGISFPGNMDVKLKALFLGALFIISLKRTGWVLRNVEDPETVSGHMYRMSIMTFLIPESSGVDKTKCMKLSLVHDLAECIVGDLTPYCGVDANEKHRQEEVAMKELTKMIGVSGAEIFTLYKEYEAQVTDESKFVKDLDRLDMILQAFEYEKLGDKPGKLEEFFKSTFNKFHFPWTIDIVKEIYKQRNLHIKKDSSLGKDP